jgi:tRNA(Ile)-lysidine synthase
LPDSDWALEAELLPSATGFYDNPDPWTAYLDADVCSGPLMLRTHQPGDRIAPQGMGGHEKKLNEIMINAKIPRAARDRIPLLVCEDPRAGSRIVWACGLRIDERARITSATRHFLHLHFARLAG